MKFKALKLNWSKLLLIMMLSFPLLSLSGCTTLGKKQPILISSERQWIIPQGNEFSAITKPKDPVKKVIADDDLVVMYKGELVKLEKEADARVFTSADASKTKGLIFGGLASLLMLFAGVYIKGLANTLFKPK